MAAIPFIDAHIHLRKLDHLPRDYTRDLADWNLVAAIHIDAGADGAQALAERGG